MFWLGIFYPIIDPSPLIFSKCQYQVPIRYLALTNIFLDSTAAFRKKIPASKLFLNRLKQSIYFHMALILHNAIATLAYHFPCISRWVCDAAPWQQTLATASWSVEVWKCVHDAARSVPPYHQLLFFIFFLLSHKIMWCLSISHAFSISSIACFTCSAVWDPRNLCAKRHVATREWNQCNVMPRW